MATQETIRTETTHHAEVVEGGHRDSEAIQRWIASTLELALELEPGELDLDEEFDQYGLDSVEAVKLVSGLEDWLGIEVAPTLAYEYPTIRSLSEYLAEATRGEPLGE